MANTQLKFAIPAHVAAEALLPNAGRVYMSVSQRSIVFNGRALAGLSE